MPVAAEHGAGSVSLGRVTGSEPAGHLAGSREGFQLPESTGDVSRELITRHREQPWRQPRIKILRLEGMDPALGPSPVPGCLFFLGFEMSACHTSPPQQQLSASGDTAQGRHSPLLLVRFWCQIGNKESISNPPSDLQLRKEAGQNWGRRCCLARTDLCSLIFFFFHEIFYLWILTQKLTARLFEVQQHRDAAGEPCWSGNGKRGSL